MEQVKWFDRAFDFSYTQNIFPSIIERLAGTPVRLEEKLKTTAAEVLSIKVDASWSIKENVGHLIDLEPLWQQRLEDIITGKQDLTPTDLTNRNTHEANHNAAPIEHLLQQFRKVRLDTVNRISKLNEEQIFKSALHPRLRTPMRTTDLFLFVADHDDHHLARISELTRLIH